MKQMCKKKFQSPCVCSNELSNPRCLTVSVNSAVSLRLQTTGLVEINYPGMVCKKTSDSINFSTVNHKLDILVSNLVIHAHSKSQLVYM